MNPLTRRAFLAKLSALTAGGIIARETEDAPGFGWEASRTREPQISFPTAPRDRIAVASYPFRAYIDSPDNRERNRSLPGMDLTGFAAEVVRKFNVRNIEPHSRHFRSLDPAYLGGFREALEKNSVKVVDIAVDGRDSFYDADRSTRKRAVDYAKRWVDAAAEVGSPSIRTHIRRPSNSAPSVERTSESLREVAAYGAERNVVVNLENDDLVSEDAFFLVRVIVAVNHPFLRALPDFANSMQTGNADFNYRALAAMFEHAYCICHVKDGETSDAGELLSIDLKKSFDILKASGYRGYCSMEFDATGEPYAPTARLIEETIRYLT
ncbi:MAG TPA: sugar phosphate isomerase/epimerase family protein [Candidatus Cybelea sp.]|nr:sugar phosphate isomerase/epimerase family protein [Candidatus Cybelea sp.]